LTRKLLKRASFTSVDELVAKVLEFIHYYNQTMAKLFKWTYEGKPLTV
jgi:putative transposase